MIPKIFNKSDGKWAFKTLAAMLSKALWVDIGEDTGDINYLLAIDTREAITKLNILIPLKGIKISSDKRELEKIFIIMLIEMSIMTILLTNSMKDLLKHFGKE
jgi:hypothetical protein